MKKGIIIAICLLVALGVIAKDDEPKIVMPRNAEGKVQYQEVAEIPGVTAATLFSRAKNWCTNAFVSVKDTLQNEDAGAGRLTYKGNFDIPGPMGVSQAYWFTLTIEVKDGKARITLVDFEMRPPNGAVYPIESDKTLKDDGTPRWGCAKLLVNLDEKAKRMISDIKAALAKEEEKW